MYSADNQDNPSCVAGTSALPKIKPLTRAEQRLLEAAEAIRMDWPTLEDFACMARQLVQVTLPHRNPGDVPEWSRTNGNLLLSIRPGWTTDAKTGQRRPIGYPYGSIPRLLLFWLTAEAVRKKARQEPDRIVQLGSSLADFMFQLGLNPATGRGPRGDARRLREQTERLFRATISFDQAIIGGRAGTAAGHADCVTRRVLVEPARSNPERALGKLDRAGREVLRGDHGSAGATRHARSEGAEAEPARAHLYAWLSYEAFRANKSGKSRFVAWQLLAGQMGTEYARTTDFQQKARAALRKIQALYPALKLGPMRGGVRVEPDSLPAIASRSAPVSGT